MGKTQKAKSRPSPLAKAVLTPMLSAGRPRAPGYVRLDAPLERSKKHIESESVGGEERLEDEKLILDALDSEVTPGVYRSYLPSRLLDTLPANCMAVHPTEKRFCRVAVFRYMHQVEKARKNNETNRRLGVAGTTYVTWQFMPRNMVRNKRQLGDRFFDENDVTDSQEEQE